jgi:site-specific recombinase XerD
MVDEGELGAVLSARTNPEVRSRNRAALLLTANMGLRCREVVTLSLDDVDFRNGTAAVAATKCQDARMPPLEAGACEALADYVAHHRPRSDSRAVFLLNKSHRGEPMSLPQMRGSLRYQARLAGSATSARICCESEPPPPWWRRARP